MPTDFSEHSKLALRYAAELARLFDCEVIACHIIEPEAFQFALAVNEGSPSAQPTIDQQASRARELAEETMAAFDIREGRVLIEPGHAFPEILRLARNEDVDLIVIATHGRGAVAHMFLGSVAEKVVRKAPCPVLVVREGEHDFVMP